MSNFCWIYDIWILFSFSLIKLYWYRANRREKCVKIFSVFITLSVAPFYFNFSKTMKNSSRHHLQTETRMIMAFQEISHFPKHLDMCFESNPKCVQCFVSFKTAPINSQSHGIAQPFVNFTFSFIRLFPLRFECPFTGKYCYVIDH